MLEDLGMIQVQIGGLFSWNTWAQLGFRSFHIGHESVHPQYSNRWHPLLATHQSLFATNCESNVLFSSDVAEEALSFGWRFE